MERAEKADGKRRVDIGKGRKEGRNKPKPNQNPRWEILGGRAEERVEATRDSEKAESWLGCAWVAEEVDEDCAFELDRGGGWRAERRRGGQ
jgi:hypothetical protein